MVIGFGGDDDINIHGRDHDVSEGGGSVDGRTISLTVT